MTVELISNIMNPHSLILGMLPYPLPMEMRPVPELEGIDQASIGTSSQLARPSQLQAGGPRRVSLDPAPPDGSWFEGVENYIQSTFLYSYTHFVPIKPEFAIRETKIELTLVNPPHPRVVPDEAGPSHQTRIINNQSLKASQGLDFNCSRERVVDFSRRIILANIGRM